MTTPNPTTTTINERTHRSGQSWNYQLTIKAGPRRLRVAIKRDSYDEQSFAKVECWSGTEWREVVTAPISECQCKNVSYGDRDITAADFACDASRLTAEAIEIIF